MRPRIVISGWYGNRNVGDEAQLAGMIKMIRKKWPKAEITVFSNNPNYTKNVHNVDAIKRDFASFPLRFKKLLKADVFLLGGGSLIFDSSSVPSQIQWLNQAVYAKLSGTPVMYFNAGIGPINNKITKFMTSAVMSKFDAITVRESQSKSRLNDLGIHKEIHVGADSVFALQERNQKGCGIAVNVREWVFSDSEYRTDKNFETDLADILNDLGQEVEFFPISFSNKGTDNDIEFSERIGKRVPRSSVYAEENFEKMIKHIGKKELMIGTRLHSLVFSAIAGKPMIAIKYAPKVEYFMRMMGQEKYLISPNQTDKIKAMIKDVRKESKKIRQKTREMKKRSENSILILEEILENPPNNLFWEGLKLSFVAIPCMFLMNFKRVYNKLFN